MTNDSSSHTVCRELVLTIAVAVGVVVVVVAVVAATALLFFPGAVVVAVAVVGPPPSTPCCCGAVSTYIQRRGESGRAGRELVLWVSEGSVDDLC